ncbi:MAG: hypothetical protein QOK38_3549, partial [Acidobacteriaceae bacterium]|nr:hypothetical protein [Acidobacteriaceae bacterium]
MADVATSGRGFDTGGSAGGDGDDALVRVCLLRGVRLALLADQRCCAAYPRQGRHGSLRASSCAGESIVP